MRNFLLLSFLISTSLAFSQALSITDEHGDDVANTTVVVDILSTDILADNEYDIGYECHINNTTSSAITVTLLRETNNIPSGSESYFCAGIYCMPPTVSTFDYSISGMGTNLSALHYKPKGSTENATVIYLYTYEGSTSETRITVEYNVVDNTRINNKKEKGHLLAYPNPANSNVTISYNSNKAGEIVLYNIIGEQVKKVEINAGSQKQDIETDNLPSGTYFYSLIIDSKAVETKRLVIKH